jgi:hypothetical protein
VLPRLWRRVRDAWRESERRYQAALDEEAVEGVLRGREETEAETGDPLREPDAHLRRRRRRRP